MFASVCIHTWMTHNFIRHRVLSTNQRIKSLEAGAPAVAERTAFWSHAVPSGNTISDIDSLVFDVINGNVDCLQQEQHVLAQITGHKKEQHGANCFSEIWTSPGACSHAAIKRSWTSPLVCSRECRHANGPVIFSFVANCVVEGTHWKSNKKKHPKNNSVIIQINKTTINAIKNCAPVIHNHCHLYH